MSPETRARRATTLLPLILLLLAQASPHARAQAAPDQKLERAIAVLRHVKESDFKTEAQQEAKSKEIEAAWEVIRQAGAGGVARLKQEVERVDRASEKDDYFKLNASALLWGIGKLDEAPAIAAIWNSTPLEAQYNYVFYTAMDAARTQDARALPMLEAVLRDDKGEVFFWQHSMEVKWPLTHEFVWGAFGPKGLPRLAEILRSSKNPVEIQSALIRLAQSQFLDALPRIRELARTGTGDVRYHAIRALGTYGHPQDYDFLIAGLSSRDVKEVFSHVYALYEYDDLRAVPRLVPLLDSADEGVRQETFAALTHLLTAEGVDALHKYSTAAKSKEERDAAAEHLATEFKVYNLSLAQYLKKPAAERAAAVADIRRRREAGRFVLGAGEPGRLTREQFLEAAREWKKKGRLEGAGRERVEPKHILAAATPADIELLLDVRAALYLRLSDESLYETRRIDEAVKHLGRRRYRKEPGITEQVNGDR